MIEGVKVKKLVWKKDERGRLAEILRSDDDMFKGFGQIYVTVVNPGFAKAWHMHKNQTDNMFCIKGKVKLVIYDPRKKSKSFDQVQELVLSFDDPVLVQITPQVYHGFESTTNEESAVINIPNKLYNYKNPDEFRLPFNTKEIPYKWNAKKGG